MFTGLVEEVGLIKKKKVIPDGLSITVEAHKILHDLKINDSVSCSGICLTVVEIDKNMFSVQIVQETIKLTNIQQFSLTLLKDLFQLFLFLDQLTFEALILV